MSSSSYGNPTLAYLYRRFLANRLLQGLAPGRFLEIGVGSGRFYEDIVRLGFSGLCLDLNAELIRAHESNSEMSAGKVRFKTQNFFSISGPFDLLVAFEVLEHYGNDIACLQRWKELLEPGGTLLFSVPAHMRRWTENDTCAGHARRYERLELTNRLEATGFQVESVWCYGFPVLNLTYPLSSKLAKDSGAPDLSDPLMKDYGRTSVSGKPRLPWFPKFLLHRWLWSPALYAQLLTMGGELGTGYIVRCRRPLE